MVAEADVAEYPPLKKEDVAWKKRIKSHYFCHFRKKITKMAKIMRFDMIIYTGNTNFNHLNRVYSEFPQSILG